MIDRGQRLDWFESPEICLEAFTAAIAFWIFVAHSLTATRPFLDPRLLLDRNFAIGLVLAFFMGMLAFTSLVLFPGMLHDLRNYPDSAIGLLLASRGLGNWMAFLVVVPFSRRYPRLSVATGLCAQAYRRLVDGAVRHQCRQFRRVLDECAAGVRVRARLHADDGARLRHPAGAAR